MTTRSRHRAAFTLIELLVVIAIISLLMSILLPSLSRARKLTRRALCASNIRQLTVANIGYSAENNGHFVLAAEDMLVRGGNRKRWHGERIASGGSADPEKNRFDPELGPLVGYLSGGAVAQCPEFCPTVGDGFEAGCGGYGYNQYYIGGRYDDESYSQSARGSGRKACQVSARQSEIKNPGSTVMFADAAILQPGGIAEYSFCEPPRSVASDNSPGDRLAASIHFRHLDKCNVAWADGHVDAQAMSFTSGYSVYGVSERDVRENGFGWFGPDRNELFDLD